MKQLQKQRRQMDYLILIATLVLVCFGIVMVYSSSYYLAETKYEEAQMLLNKQIIGAVLGLAIMLILSKFNYKRLQKLTMPIVIVSIGLLLLVLVIGNDYYGAQRWISIGGVSLQPAEIAKFALILFMARFASRYPKRMRYLVRGAWPCILVTGVFLVLIYLQPNFSTVVTMAVLFFAMLIACEVPGKQLGVLAGVGVAGVIGLIFAAPYRVQRLLVFLDPWKDPADSGYQLIQSFYAIASGGFFGRGLGFSRQKYLFLPFGESDFIFAIIVEELGFLGALVLLGVYAFLIYRGIRVAVTCNDRFGSLLAAGISALLGIQVAINIGVVTGCLPPTGLPLPFISSGLTSLVIFMAAIGVLLNISKDCVPVVKKKKGVKRVSKRNASITKA